MSITDLFCWPQSVLIQVQVLKLSPHHHHHFDSFFLNALTQNIFRMEVSRLLKSCSRPLNDEQLCYSLDPHQINFKIRCYGCVAQSVERPKGPSLVQLY